ncbi:MutS protein 4, partial [Fasciolopsis buskii]
LSELLRLCHPEYHPAIRAIGHRFYALSASAALLSYAEEVHGFRIVTHTLKFVFTGSFQTSLIDIHTAFRLELVENLNTRLPKGSLFAVIDNTSNPSGARLLRTNLLQPPSDLSTIVSRQNAVNELLSHPHSLLCLQNILRRLPYIDGLLSFCIQMSNTMAKNARTPFLQTDSTKSNKPNSTDSVPKDTSNARSLLDVRDYVTSDATVSSRLTLGRISVNIRMAELRITKLIAIKSLLDQVVPLKNALNDLNSTLFQTYRKLLDDPRYAYTQKKLCTVLHEDIHISKGLLAMQSQKCFAIKEGLNVVLDVTRKAYSEQLDDITGNCKFVEYFHISNHTRISCSLAFY